MATSVSSSHTYRNISEVTFHFDEEPFVTIDTEDLHIRSVNASQEDHDSYVSLFTNKTVMEKYASAKESIESRINTWIKGWQQHDPFNGLAVFKNDTDEFVGNILLEYDAPGRAAFSHLYMQIYWGRKYGTKAAFAVIKEFAPAIVKEKYFLDSEPLKEIIAAARCDNITSNKILKGLGMHKVKEEEKYGAMRNHYSISLAEILNKV